jgi:phosphatidylinositol-3-phosphatase
MGSHAARRLLAIVGSAMCVLGAAPTPGWTAPAAQPRATPAGVSVYTKVLVIAEENRTYAQIVGAKQAPFLTGLARRFGSASNMSANFPVHCPSLAGYLLMTSGSASGICDDQGPKHHALPGANIFAQVAAANLTSRTYAESIPAPCARKNSSDEVFLVRHTPVAYYSSESARCATEDIELGSLNAGALRQDIDAGNLPSYAFVTPNTCHDMHGANTCPDRRVVDGDAWLSGWIPALLRGKDYSAGRLVVIITWDEGSTTDNHIPTLVISPTSRAVVSATAYTHCSTLRTVEDVLHLAPLGCAATATSMTGAFHL